MVYLKNVSIKKFFGITPFYLIDNDTKRFLSLKETVEIPIFFLVLGRISFYLQEGYSLSKAISIIRRRNVLYFVKKYRISNLSRDNKKKICFNKLVSKLKKLIGVKKKSNVVDVTIFEESNYEKFYSFSKEFIKEDYFFMVYLSLRYLLEIEGNIELRRKKVKILNEDESFKKMIDELVDKGCDLIISIFIKEEKEKEVKENAVHLN